MRQLRSELITCQECLFSEKIVFMIIFVVVVDVTSIHQTGQSMCKLCRTICGCRCSGPVVPRDNNLLEYDAYYLLAFSTAQNPHKTLSVVPRYQALQADLVWLSQTVLYRGATVNPLLLVYVFLSVLIRRSPIFSWADPLDSEMAPPPAVLH